MKFPLLLLVCAFSTGFANWCSGQEGFTLARTPPPQTKASQFDMWSLRGFSESEAELSITSSLCELSFETEAYQETSSVSGVRSLTEIVAENLLAILALIASAWSIWYARNSNRSAQEANRIAQEAHDFATKPVEAITDSDKMGEVLPTWFMKRMASDDWHFGMLLRSGQVLVFTRILQLSSDARWLEVEMAEDDGHKVTEFFKEGPAKDLPTIYSLPGRKTASVSVGQIIACFELANT